MLIAAKPYAPPSPVAQKKEASTAEKFDLSAIDTPTEAFLMPGADIIAGMVLTQLSGKKNKPVKLALQVGDQKMQFTEKKSNGGTTMQGNINGKPFKLDGKLSDPTTMILSGQTSGGNIQESVGVDVNNSAFVLNGKLGTVDFNESFSVNQFGGTHIGDLTGNFGGDALKVSFDGDLGSLQATGTLGNRQVSDVVSPGPNGTVVIDGTIGDTKFHEDLSKA